MTTGATPSSATRIATCASFLLAALLAASCSSSAKPPAPVAATSAASSIATTATAAAATPAPSASSPPGTVVLDQSQLTTICTPPQTDSTDATGSSSGSIMGVLPGAVAIISCGAQVAGYDLNTSQTLWQEPIGADPSASGDGAPAITVALAGQHIYAFETDTVAADGLIAAYTTAHLTSYNPKTGQPAWSQPLEPGNKTIDTSSAKVIEIPAKTDGQTQTIVSLSDADIALDSASGVQQWTRAPLDQSVTYLGSDLGLKVDTGDPVVLTALDNATGRQVWQQSYPSADVALTSQNIPELVGHTIWFFATTGYDTFDLSTGAHTAHVLYPLAFQHVLSTKSLTMVYVDNSLRLFHLGNWSKPLWSVTSDDATPLAVTDAAVLVNSATGPQILSGDAGTLLTSSLSAQDIGSDPLTVQDGFAYTPSIVIALG